MSSHPSDRSPANVRSVLVHSVRFQHQVCEIHVTEHTTTQGEPSFRAAAYETDPSTGELRVVKDEAGVQYEVYGPAPATVAERLAELLETRYGERLSESGS